MSPSPDDVAKREHIVLPVHYGSGLRQWAVLLAPMVAVYIQQQLGYAFVTWACHRDARALVHLPTLLALVITIVAVVFAWRAYRAAGVREPADERASDARERFMAVCALTLSAFMLVVLVAMWLPTIFVHPCQR